MFLTVSLVVLATAATADEGECLKDGDWVFPTVSEANMAKIKPKAIADLITPVCVGEETLKLRVLSTGYAHPYTRKGENDGHTYFLWDFDDIKGHDVVFYWTADEPKVVHLKVFE